MTYTTITVHDEPEEFPCDACFEDTHYSNLFEGTNGDRLCPDCFDEREDNEQSNH